MAPPYEICICIGRFQPFHWGHLALVHAALAQGQRVIILLGSDQSSSPQRNPWTAAEREHMIRANFGPVDNGRMNCLPVRDCPTFEDWSAQIHRQVATVTVPTDRVAILSTHPQGNQFFRQYFPHWTYVEKVRQPGLQATDIRRAYFQGAPEQSYQDQVPAGTLAFLQTFKCALRYHRIAADF
jgi:bifunctional NMN adenylyltransferase/nudix hydrolase